MLTQTSFRRGVLVATSLMMAACASGVKKSEISSSANPSEEITRVESMMNEGLSQQLDVLDSKNFEKGQEWLQEAKKDMAKGEKQREILDDVAYAEAHFQQAASRGESRRAQIPAVLEAREKALQAGAREFPPTRVELKALDKRLQSEAGEFQKLSAEKLAGIQSAFLDLELNSIVNRQLGSAKAQILGAKDKKAERYSPRALKVAETDYLTAENTIRANRNQESSYSDVVAKSALSAQILTATLAATKGGNVDENTAAKLVAQDRQINELRGNLSAAEQESQNLQGVLTTQGKELNKAGQMIGMQQALENARKQFSPEEADVFQQGDKLLIRLKSMNFASGRSDLPANTLPVLAKLRDVASSLSPQSVVVEGHTDSIGKKALNNALSQERADSVAKYLEANGLSESHVSAKGYGFDKPIATNKTKAGRSQNRRVDVIVTPAQGQTNGKKQDASL